MGNDIIQIAKDWAIKEKAGVDFDRDYYCQTQDVLQSRLGKMQVEFIKSGINEMRAFIVSAITGEIGNNSFDHNIGNWRDVMGIFFAYDPKGLIVIADRGQGIFGSLNQIDKKIKSDKEALEVAFTKRISGRAPEKRGNGLKFVRESAKENKMHIKVFSGNAVIEVNQAINASEITENFKGCLSIIEF
jgi:hypothetical protein